MDTTPPSETAGHAAGASPAALQAPPAPTPAPAGAPTGPPTSRSQDDCYVCLNRLEFRGGRMMVNPGCGHQLHFECLQDYVKAGHTVCGVCKRPIPPQVASLARPATAGAFAPPPAAPMPRFGHPAPPMQAPLPYQQMMYPVGAFPPPPAVGNIANMPQSARYAPYRGAPRSGSPGRVQNEHNPADDDDIAPQQTVAEPLGPALDPQTLLTVNLISEKNGLTADAGATVHAAVVQARDAPPTETAVQARPACDLVVVLDKSGSMGGSKIASVRDTLRFIVSALLPGDRLAIVAFESHASRLLPLTRVTPANAQKFEDAISSLEGMGGTTIASGLDLGVDILVRRRQSNQLKALFLMSDGEDGQAREACRPALRKAASINCPVYSFGFGAQHDSETLMNLAAGGGVYTFADTVESFRPAMGGALGALVGQAVQELSLKFSVPDGHSITKIVSGNDQGIEISPTHREATVRYPDQLYGEKKVVLIHTTHRGLAQETVFTQQVVLRLAEVAFKQPGGQMVVLEALPEPLALPVLGAGQAVTRERAVVRETTRVWATEAIEHAVAMARSRQFDAARESLSAVKSRIKELLVASTSSTAVGAAELTPNDAPSLAHDHTFYQGLLADVAEAETKVASFNAYETEGGHAWLRQTTTNMHAQRSVAPQSRTNAAYQAPMTSRMSERASLFPAQERRRA